MPNPSTILRARTLRHNLTEVEKVLWLHLRNRKFYGYKFKRQVPLGPYFLDFLCFEKKIAIELDGTQHQDDLAQRRHDNVREKYLEQEGIKVLRFWNNEVNDNLQGVLERILQELEK